MLNAINISHVFVADQDKALDFYVGKLGLEITNDQDLGFMRWLTVRVPGRPGRDILLESPPAAGTNGLPRFVGLRTPRYKYVRHLSGPVELYDLRHDPDETRNLAHAAAFAHVRAELRRRLARLAGCAGVTCR